MDHYERLQIIGYWAAALALATLFVAFFGAALRNCNDDRAVKLQEYAACREACPGACVRRNYSFECRPF